MFNFNIKIFLNAKVAIYSEIAVCVTGGGLWQIVVHIVWQSGYEDFNNDKFHAAVCSVQVSSRTLRGCALPVRLARWIWRLRAAK